MISFSFSKGFALFKTIILIMARMRPRRSHFWAHVYTPSEQPAYNSTPETPAENSTPELPDDDSTPKLPDENFPQVISFRATDTARCQIRLNFRSPNLVSTFPRRALMINFAQFCSHLGHVCGLPEDIYFSCDENESQLYTELTFDNGSGRYHGGSEFTVSQDHGPWVIEIVDPNLVFDGILSGEVSPPSLLADALMSLPQGGPEVSVFLDANEAQFFGDNLLSRVPLRDFDGDFDGDLPYEMRIGFHRTSRNAVIALLRQVARVWICASDMGQCSFQCLLPDGHGSVKVTFCTAGVLEHYQGGQ